MALFFDQLDNFCKAQVPAIYNASATTIVLDSVIAGVGQVTTNGTTTLTGVGTTFLNTYHAGDTITVQGETIRTIASVSTDLILIVTVPFITTATNLAFVVGGGARFPDPAIMGPTIGGPYNCVWWDQKTYPDPDDDPNKEIVRVTAKVGDTLTIIRAQEDTLATTKNSFGGLYAISNVLTKFVMDQIRTALGLRGAIIETYGVQVPREPILNFTKYFNVSDNPGNTSSDVSIDIAGLTSDPTFISDIHSIVPGGSGHVIQDHGTPKPAEPALNLVNFFNVTDNPGVATDVNIDVAALTSDPTFLSDLITNLVSDPTFITDIQTMAGGAPYFIDQTPSTGTYGLLGGAVNGINTTFTVSQSLYLTGKLLVYRNGLAQLQGAGDDWVETVPGSGTFDFVVAPLGGDIITVLYQTTAGLIQVPIQFDNQTGAHLGSAGTVNEVEVTGSGVIGARAGNKVTYTIAGGSGSVVQKSVTQANAFTVGQVVKSSGVDGEYALAEADIAVDANVVGIVSTAGNPFVLTTEGFVILSAGIPGGAVAGDSLWLDPATPGLMTLTEPVAIGTVSQPVGRVINAATGEVYIHNWRGIINTVNPSFSGFINNVTASQAGNSGGLQTIAHGLGTTPTIVKIQAYHGPFNGDSYSSGEMSGGNTNCIVKPALGSSRILSGKIAGGSDGVGGSMAAAMTVDATNVYLTWTLVAGGCGAADIQMLISVSA